MARVVCTLMAKGWIGGVLYSRVALDPVTFWRIRVKVDICRLESYVCRVVRDVAHVASVFRVMLQAFVQNVSSVSRRMLQSFFIWMLHMLQQYVSQCFNLMLQQVV
jgi:hypothetical protein